MQLVHQLPIHRCIGEFWPIGSLQEVSAPVMPCPEQPLISRPFRLKRPENIILWGGTGLDRV